MSSQVWEPLHLIYFEYCPRTRCALISWDLTRNAESQIPHQTHWIRICICMLTFKKHWFSSTNEGNWMTTPSYKVDCAHASSQSYSALCHPMDYCPPGSFVMAFSRQEYWSGLLFPPPRDLPNLRIKPASLVSPALAGRFFTTAQPGKSPPPQKIGLSLLLSLVEEKQSG